MGDRRLSRQGLHQPTVNYKHGRSAGPKRKAFIKAYNREWRARNPNYHKAYYHKNKKSQAKNATDKDRVQKIFQSLNAHKAHCLKWAASRPLDPTAARVFADFAKLIQTALDDMLDSTIPLYKS
jgi:hypothetical protein